MKCDKCSVLPQDPSHFYPVSMYFDRYGDFAGQKKEAIIHPCITVAPRMAVLAMIAYVIRNGFNPLPQNTPFEHDISSLSAHTVARNGEASL